MPLNAVWIDHEDEYIESVKPQLTEKYNIIHFKEFDEAQLESVLWTDVDVVIMEMKLKDVECLNFVANMRKKKDGVPIIIVTSNADKANCVQAINLGVNGLLEKPVDAIALKGILDRFCSKATELKMSHDRKAVYSQSKWVDLTSTEYKILETLKRARRRLTRAELQSAVWPNSSISENNLDTHLTNLKRKIPELNQCLNVKRGLGYYLESR